VSDPFLRATTLFQEQCADGAFPGGQLVAMRDGAVLCQVSCGLGRGFRGESPEVPVTDATRFQVMSASKPFVALAIALLEDAGLVDVSAPVARYVPVSAGIQTGA
jgi:CubicO group peptidase (beta-lactamase class C family)